MNACRAVSRALVAMRVLAVLALVPGACGFPAEDEPRLLDPDSVGYDLLSPTTAPPVTLACGAITDVAYLYLVNADDRTVARVERKVAAPKNTATVLRALFDARPTEADQEAGLSNVITSQTRLLEVREAGSRVVLDLDSYFPGLNADEVSLAIAQIVYTLGELDARTELAIFVRGQPEDVRTGDGKSVSEVSMQDLQDFDRRNTPSTGTTVPARPLAPQPQAPTTTCKPSGP